MSLRANDALGVSKKPGLYSILEYKGSPASVVGACSASQFNAIRYWRGDSLVPLTDGDGGLFCGILVTSPGAYTVDTGYIYAATNDTLDITVNQPLTRSLDPLQIISRTLVPAGLPNSTSGTFIFEGGDIIRVHSSVNPTADVDAFIRVTKVSGN